jgi:hypothetical protein
MNPGNNLVPRIFGNVEEATTMVFTMQAPQGMGKSWYSERLYNTMVRILGESLCIISKDKCANDGLYWITLGKALTDIKIKYIIIDAMNMTENFINFVKLPPLKGGKVYNFQVVYLTIFAAVAEPINEQIVEACAKRVFERGPEVNAVFPPLGEKWSMGRIASSIRKVGELYMKQRQGVFKQYLSACLSVGDIDPVTMGGTLCRMFVRPDIVDVGELTPGFIPYSKMICAP